MEQKESAPKRAAVGGNPVMLAVCRPRFRGVIVSSTVVLVSTRIDVAGSVVMSCLPVLNQLSCCPSLGSLIPKLQPKRGDARAGEIQRTGRRDLVES